MRADTIVGYTYKADTYCPTCTIEIMIRAGEASPAARDMNTENALDQIAEANAIDRYDQTTFDSDDFPKVVFADQANDARCDHCGMCGEHLVETECFEEEL